jgi:hypothetical protein
MSNKKAPEIGGNLGFFFYLRRKIETLFHEVA